MGCDRAAEAPAEPLRFTSSVAGYSLQLPAGWHAVNPKIFDNGADFAANHEDRLLMIIATRRPPPALPGRPKPGVEVFAREGIAQLQRDVDQLTLVSQRPITLGPRQLEASLVVADGQVNQRPSRYMIAYTQSEQWRFQIVAWSHATHAAQLAEELDATLATWQFAPAPAAITPPTDADAGHPHRSD